MKKLKAAEIFSSTIPHGSVIATAKAVDAKWKSYGLPSPWRKRKAAK
jgi:hypothetical protein